jgi:hypothetical protein
LRSQSSTKFGQVVLLAIEFFQRAFEIFGQMSRQVVERTFNWKLLQCHEECERMDPGPLLKISLPACLFGTKNLNEAKAAGYAMQIRAQLNSLSAARRETSCVIQDMMHQLMSQGADKSERLPE